MTDKTKKQCTMVPKAAKAADEDAPPAALSRDAILQAQDIQVAQVAVPEWGGSVYVRGLTGAERDTFEQRCMDSRKGRQINIKGLKTLLVVMSVVDAEGQKMFAPKDAEALQAKSARPIERIYKAASDLSGLTDDDVEELTKNSDGELSANSGTS